MRGVVIAFVSVVLLIVAFIVVRGLLSGAGYVLAAGVGAAHSGAFTVGGDTPKEQGPYTLHGTAIMDVSNGIPAVPYIQYIDTNHATSTKQLVYMDARACAPGAGDYPCAPSYSASSGYPQLTTGEAITVTGYIYENRFLVISLSGG